MLKRTIKYTDFNDQEQTEIFYFNLTRAELVDMQFSTEEGFGEMLQRIVESTNIQELIAVFKKIVLASYGEKSADGKRFNKLNADGQPLSVEFVQTAAYDALFIELSSNADAFADFVKGIMPAGLTAEAAAVEAKNKSAEVQINEALAANGLPGLSPPTAGMSVGVDL